MDLHNASALVTGGAGGFGMATVRRLAKRGAKVVIADVNAERGEALAAELDNGSVYVHTDITDEASIANAVQTAVGLVAGGMGVALVPESFRENLQVKGVVYRSLVEETPVAELIAVWRTDNRAPLLLKLQAELKTVLVERG